MSRGVGWGQDREGTYVRPPRRTNRRQGQQDYPLSALPEREQARFREMAIEDALALVQGRADWQTRLGPDDVHYLLSALAAARKENEGLKAELRALGYIFPDGEMLWLGRALRCADYPALTAALVRRDDGAAG